MKNNVLVFIFLIISFTSVSAQCDKCPKVSEKIDYCYRNDLFSNFCAQFVADSTYFYFSKEAKAQKIKFTKPVKLEVLVEIAKNKNYKLTATDILFLETALNVWKVEERKLGFTMQPSGLGIKILKEGTGELPQPGKQVTVHYTGSLEDGTIFDSSVSRGQPFSFSLGMGQVIKGWDEGISKLKIGTKAILLIPANLGYGAYGTGPIPGNATLFFEVEVIGQ
jgi:FKBP-type peptidyl-prolyl cis-trans isomerase